MSDEAGTHFDPLEWFPNWLAKCAEIGADPLIRHADGYCCPSCDGDLP